MNNIKLSISIMHCSDTNERKQMLNLVESKIDKSLLCGFYISDDVDRKGIWWNYKQALNNRPLDATHHIVLQDDMIPCDNFVPTILQIINKLPNNVIHYFASSKHYNDLCLLGYNIFKCKGGIWGGSVVLPKEHFNWYNWVEKYFSNNAIGKHYDDERQSLYFEWNNIDIYCITPSLTQHIGNNSLIGNPTGRQAFTKIYDGYSIDWSKVSLNCPDVGFIWGYSPKELKRTLNLDNRNEFLSKYCDKRFRCFLKKAKEYRCNTKF